MDGIERALEGEGYVHEGSNRLDVARLLCVVGEVALAGLVFGIPFEDVKLPSQTLAVGNAMKRDWSIGPEDLLLLVRWGH